jgi:CheY-like chemotaxis protein
MRNSANEINNLATMAGILTGTFAHRTKASMETVCGCKYRVDRTNKGPVSPVIRVVQSNGRQFAASRIPLLLRKVRANIEELQMPGNARIRKILIVEDETAIADTLAAILSTCGYWVQVAYTAEKAIDIIAGWQPDVAIVDVMLPLMNGFDFSIILTANYPACRLLLFSGEPDTAALLGEALKKGRNFEVFAKPLHPTFVLATVESLLSSGPEPLADA